MFGQLGRRFRGAEKRSREAVGGNVLDFSKEASQHKAETVVVGEEYDSRPHEDNARRTIAYLLIGLLWLIIAAMLIMVAFGSITVEDLKDFSVIIGPIITLVSAATGFYYGTKTSR